MVVIESTGRKLKDAIDNGLAKLNKTLMDVDVEVLDNGGLFRKAKVRITVKGENENETSVDTKREPQVEQAKSLQTETPKSEIRTPASGQKTESASELKPESHEPKKETKKPEPKKEGQREVREQKTPQKQNPERKREEQRKDEQQPDENKELRKNVPITDEAAKQAEQLVRNIVAKMGIETEVTSSIVSGGVVVNLESNSSELIGYHGEVLDAIEYIVSCAINKDDDKYYRVVVDCDNYRAKRKESLVILANRMATKCLKVRHKVMLEPMNSNERRIIHATLAGNDKIITRSEGHEPNRRVVIFCKRR